MLNKVTLIGNLGDNPNIRNLPDGSRVANFSIATSERWKDKDGNRQERTEWHRVTIWNENLVKVVEQYTKKGTKLYVEGQLQTRKWQDKDGHDRYTTEIVLKPYRGQIVLLDGKDDNNSDPSQSTGTSYNKSGGDYASASGGTSAYANSHQRPFDDDDSVPF